MAAAGRAAAAALFFLTVFNSSVAIADDIERITDFHDDVTVARDGTLSVTETITVNAQGDDIVHGIFRDFPTIYRAGNTHVRFDVSGVRMDGYDAPFHLQDIDNGKRVQIGDADATLPHGLHTFVLHYVTDRQIAFGAKQDELYWNVTGNGWDFAIDHASAVIRLPSGARLTGTTSFTGAQGEHGGNAVAHVTATTVVTFETTQRLDPNQGLTVVADFAKGAVLAPSESDRWRYLARDNKGAAGALAGLMLLCVYFAVAWVLAGRDPRRGTIIPLFEPPHDLSPAAMRFVHRMHYDRKAFAATIVGLAVKGMILITETPHFLGPTFTVKRTDGSDAELTRVERSVVDALLPFAGEEVELSQKNHGQVAWAISTLKKDLGAEYERVYFNSNIAWFWPGIAIVALSAVAAAVLSDNLGTALLTYLWSGLFGIAAALFSYYAFSAWQAVFSGVGSRTVNIGIALLRTAAALPFIAVLIGVAFFLYESIQPVTWVLLAIEGIVAVVFYHLLRAPTRAGAKLRDAIDGFALYLKTAEQPRMAMEITPALFEKFLPYAIALDCETAWSRKFEAATAEAGTGSGGGSGHLYNPMWYQGASFSSLGTAMFVSSIGASIGNAAASASVAPGGGGGMGGSSGGGGGGGGGGGW